jgi:quercetin dioxygenase-like cupin family protein
VFGISVAAMFEGPAAEGPCLIVRASEAVAKKLNGLTYAPLSDADRFFNVQPLRVRISTTRKDNEHFRHEGSEWIHVLSGQLTLSLAGKLYQLEVGDSAHFDSRLSHRLIARGRRDAEILLVASPFSETATLTQRSGFREHRAIPLADRASG